MSWSCKNRPIKFYSLLASLTFLFVIIVYKIRKEKRLRNNCDSLQKLETLSDIASKIGTCDILDLVYTINILATPIIIPDNLWVKVRSWLQEDAELLKSATNQNVIHITNKVTLKDILFLAIFIYKAACVCACVTVSHKLLVTKCDRQKPSEARH